MNEEEIKKILDKAELMGYDRGVKTIFIQIFQLMESQKMLSISYTDLKKLYEATQPPLVN